jgi:high-affinity Fe2+/Pb2+ permease
VTRELPPDDDSDGREPPERPAGHVGTTRAGTLVGFGLTGLVLGWLLRPVSIRVTGQAPLVGWTPVLALLLVGLILGAVAWSTYRDVHRREILLEPHKAVNRLVLAKASALVGALVAGGYFGYALSWWRVSEAPLAQQRLVQSLVAGAAGVLIVAGSLLLERACRVRRGDGSDLP